VSCQSPGSVLALSAAHSVPIPLLPHRTPRPLPRGWILFFRHVHCLGRVGVKFADRLTRAHATANGVNRPPVSPWIPKTRDNNFIRTVPECSSGRLAVFRSARMSRDSRDLISNRDPGDRDIDRYRSNVRIRRTIGKYEGGSSPSPPSRDLAASKCFRLARSAQGAELTLSPLNRLFDRCYERIPLFRQYRRAVPPRSPSAPSASSPPARPLMYAPRIPIFSLSAGGVLAMTPALLTPYPPPPLPHSGDGGDEGRRARTRSPLLNFGTVPVGGEKKRSARARSTEETRDAAYTREDRRREGARAPGWPVGCEPELIHIPLHCFLRYNCGLLVVIHGANSISCPARGTEMEAAP